MEPLRAATFAMGTRFEFVVCGNDRVQLQAAIDAAIAEIQIWDRKLSLFRRDSVVSHINRHAPRQPVRVEAEVFELLALSRQITSASGGAFDITVAPLMKHFKLHDEQSSASDGTVVGMQNLQLDDARTTVAFSDPRTAIDLGAIGKGFALDCAAQVLRESGIRQAIIHGGTSAVVAIGAPPDRRGWGIRIHDPRLDSHDDRSLASQPATQPVVFLCDAALCVSAPHGREIEHQGERVGHVIDPRNGTPVRRSGFAAVIGRSAAVADAWSTALLVLGRRPDDLDESVTSILPSDDLAPSQSPYTVAGRFQDMIEWVAVPNSTATRA